MSVGENLNCNKSCLGQIMYNRFFGFNERPFKLVPNPAYLYMSQSHQEAMAHLVYGLDSGDGFVEITGEVGTGKTTLCRSFIEGLDKNTEIAYIFNPVLDPVELLRAVNTEFGITDEGHNSRELINSLNVFLIEKKSQGKEVVLIIDEAQILTRNELEQIRLISNLETTRSKLLQIILIGQPELRNLLNSHDLRQLRQRITLSCHLQPLSFKDTENYIRHRLELASGGEAITFSNGAVKRIYKYSRGIPRLINISCDRALLTAFGLDQKGVSTKIAKTAIKELEISSSDHGLKRPYHRKTMVVLTCAIVLIVLAGGYEFGILGLLHHEQISVMAPDRPKVASKLLLISPKTRTSAAPDRPEMASKPRVPEKEKVFKSLPVLHMAMPLASVAETSEGEIVTRVPLQDFGTIPGDAREEAVITLKLLLRDMGYNNIDIGPEYDENTRNVITQIQRQYGLRVDGVVGSMTKIALYQKKKSLEIPSLGKSLKLLKGVVE